MKKFWFIPVCAFLVTSCSSTWEYKVITVSGVEGARADFDPKNLTVDEAALTAWGMEGWELVSAYPTTETVHPNFGNSEYVTGMQPNVRTTEIVFVFKKES